MIAKGTDLNRQPVPLLEKKIDRCKAVFSVSAALCLEAYNREITEPISYKKRKRMMQAWADYGEQLTGKTDVSSGDRDAVFANFAHEQSLRSQVTSWTMTPARGSGKIGEIAFTFKRYTQTIVIQRKYSRSSFRGI